jgi:hypothetical protein
MDRQQSQTNLARAREKVSSFQERQNGGGSTSLFLAKSADNSIIFAWLATKGLEAGRLNLRSYFGIRVVLTTRRDTPGDSP